MPLVKVVGYSPIAAYLQLHTLAVGVRDGCTSTVQLFKTDIILYSITGDILRSLTDLGDIFHVSHLTAQASLMEPRGEQC